MPSASRAQHNLMAMVANDPAAAKRLGIPQKVGKEFVQADRGRHFEAHKAEGGIVKKESPAMMKKELAFMKAKKAPASMIKHEKAEYGMKKGGKASCYAKGGVAKKAVGGEVQMSSPSRSAPPPQPSPPIPPDPMPPGRESPADVQPRPVDESYYYQMRGMPGPVVRPQIGGPRIQRMYAKGGGIEQRGKTKGKMV